MEPLTVKQIRTTIDGELVQGSDHMLVYHGAYRLKQIKEQHTIFFANTKIVNLEQLIKFLPLVLVALPEYIPNERIENLTIIKVTNMEEAYWKFVKHYRSLFEIPVIAITGTAGKTTTKEMIKHILSETKRVVATNSTGNSRTAHLHYLLSIDKSTEAAVFEAAVGAPGDVLKAGDYFKPTLGIITNIGEHHLGLCKTMEAYIRDKGNMATILDRQGVLLLNAEDVHTRKIDLSTYHGRIMKVGIAAECDFRASAIRYQNDGMQFTLHFQNKKYKVHVPGFGEHQVYNALFALAAVQQIGVNLPDAIKRIESFQNFNRQLQVFQGLNGSTLIDDTWSMTSTSLTAALNVLTAIGKDKKKVAIIGSIKGLGPWAGMIHKKAGEMIAASGIDTLITIGAHANMMSKQAKENNPNLQTYSYMNANSAYNLLKRIVDKNTIVLVKGDMYATSISDLAVAMRRENG